ncbi:MAG: zeta toxin family protein [Planctomycetes bacterium]|nr:zeta toxin family protein [Planctomycetota bacterium]
MAKNPTVYIVAGPNGAGKTTFAMRFLPKFTGCKSFVNMDMIAKGISPLSMESAVIEAGRLFIQQIKKRIASRVNFAFETTLSGLGYIGLLKQLRKKNYQIHIYFLWIPKVDMALKRIANRVQLGGHGVPSEIVKRRYGKGLSNLINSYIQLSDFCAVFDNSSDDPLLIYERKNGKETILYREKWEYIIEHVEVAK